MSKTKKIDVKDKDIQGAIRGFLKTVLENEAIGAVLAPIRLPMKNMVMPTLVSHPEKLEGAAPLSPSFPLNAAKLVSKLTRKPAGHKVAAVMRPCEVRAFIELVKLKQGNWQDLVVISADCPGAFSNRDYFRYAEGQAQGETDNAFIQSGLAGTNPPVADIELMTACQACEHCVPESADILIGLIGPDPEKELMVQARTEAGEALLDQLGLTDYIEPSGRQGAVEKRIEQKIAYRDAMFERTRAETDSLEKLTTYLANCINCYNCRVACPVCYCKECVFVTDVFNHEPAQYLKWAGRKGAIKMPTDTVFYHLTRLAHMSLACVGCGQCSNACPNDISLAELFRTVAQQTQAEFKYQAGHSLEEDPPLSVFKEKEYQEVVGIK